MPELKSMVHVFRGQLTDLTGACEFKPNYCGGRGRSGFFSEAEDLLEEVAPVGCGLGFAGALTEIGLPRHQFATAIVSFNVGVELGQLAVIALAFAAVGWWRRRAWYRGAVVVPALILIAATAMFWTIQRVWGAV